MIGPSGLGWMDLDESAKSDLAGFLLAVNFEIAFVDGRRTKREADVEGIFQLILARSRSDLVRQALFHLSEYFQTFGQSFEAEAKSGNRNFVGPRIGRVRAILSAVRPDEMKRYLTAVFFVGVATAEADGPIFGSNSSPQESARLDTILYWLGLGFAGTEDVLMSWIGEGG